MRRWGPAVVGVAACTTVILASCSNATAGQSSSGNAAGRGSISGLVMKLALAPLVPPKWVPLPPPADAVAHREGGKGSVTMAVSTGGKFHGALLPGSYRISITSPSNGIKPCGTTVSVRSDHESKVTIRCEPKVGP